MAISALADQKANILHHKFRYIRLAYGVLIVGLVLTVIGVTIDIAIGNI